MSQQNQSITKESKRPMIMGIAMIGVVFFVMGFVSWVNSILIPFFKLACQLTTFQSYFVTFAFYIAYLVMSVPVAYMLKKTGYKRGLTYGFFMLALGALLFVPAAMSRAFPLFLTGLFTMGTGLAVLQSAANPYITIIGPIESAARRISIMGVCNKFAGIISPLIFSAVVLGKSKATIAMLDNNMLHGADKEAALQQLLNGVITPYAVLSALLVAIGLWIFFSKLPDINPEKDDNDTTHQLTDGKHSVFQFPYLVLGVIALFFHVGSQVIAIDTIISYADSMGIGLEEAKVFPSFTLGATLVGYLLGITLIPRFISQKNALIGCTVIGLLLSVGVIFVTTPVTIFGHHSSLSIWLLAALGFPNSLIYAGIWPHAIRNLGRFTKIGSSLLVMALCGNAIMPQVYALVAESTSLQTAYIVLIPCYLYLIFYATIGYRFTSWSPKRNSK